MVIVGFGFGGGPTGVEVSRAFAELVAMVLEQDFHEMDLAAAREILVERADTVFAPFAPALHEHTIKTLKLGTSRSA